MIVFADWTGVGAIASCVAAVAALASIWYAKQAVSAARKTVKQEQELRLRDDFREFSGALWDVQQAADDARLGPGTTSSMNRLRHAQTRLKSVRTMTQWIELPDEAHMPLDLAINRNQPALVVYGSATTVIDYLWEAWERREAARCPDVRGWPRADGLFGATSESARLHTRPGE